MSETAKTVVIYLPPQTNGMYRFADGTELYPAILRRGRWLAYRKTGGPIRDRFGDRVYFNTPDEAARALAALGEGPGAPQAGAP